MFCFDICCFFSFFLLFLTRCNLHPFSLVDGSSRFLPHKNLGKVRYLSLCYFINCIFIFIFFTFFISFNFMKIFCLIFVISLFFSSSLHRCITYIFVFFLFLFLFRLRSFFIIFWFLSLFCSSSFFVTLLPFVRFLFL